MLGSNPTRDNQVRAEANPRALSIFGGAFFVRFGGELLLSSHASKNPLSGQPLWRLVNPTR